MSDDKTASGSIGAGLDAVRIRVVAVWGESTATYWLPPGKSITVGRGDECDLRVNDASVSRKHIRIHGTIPVEVEDLGSSNGTRMAGQKLAKGARALLAPSDVVEIGSAVIVIRPPLSAPPRPLPRHDWRHVIDAIAKSRLSVVLLGETGVGKNVAAERIHEQSTRASKRLVQLNCSAVPETLLEGELFGFERGAFTGAVQAKPGLLEAADGGTVLLDEVGDLPLALQAKLLTVLETAEVTRLGGLRPRKIDFRLIVATNRDLEQLVASGQFRSDLYYRVSGITVAIPPLRERQDEIANLAKRFLAAACDAGGRARLVLSAAATKKLLEHPWPGNIRELRNTMERAAVLAAGPEVSPSDLPIAVSTAPGEPPGARSLRAEIQDIERRRVLEALERCGGNQSRAARVLGISRRTLVSRLDEYGVSRPRKG